MGTTTNSKIIKAPKEKVYNAFISKNALEYWLAPDNMVGTIYDFEAKVGGGYTMSLFYIDKEIAGKTSGNEDRFTAKFVELQPYDKIVETIHFQSDKNKFANEMTMEVLLETAADNSTVVTIIFRNIPLGIDPKDNEVGTEQSLQKLTRFLDKDW